MRKSALFIFAPVAAAVVIAGCGGSGGGSGHPSAPGKAHGGAPTVALVSSKFGNILVDSHGRTLYDLTADKMDTSTCYEACASVWPPLTVSGTPKAGPGVLAALLGTTKRSDGTTEVSYDGHPLYYFPGDTRPGETTGQGLNQFGGPWYVLTRYGAEVTHA
jgi:predicted lipoprotein with Yx(FWY)xxD motif